MQKAQLTQGLAGLAGAILGARGGTLGALGQAGVQIGAGMVMLPLLVLSGRRLFVSFDIARRDLVLSAIALATILIVDLSGLLRAENARVWLFLQPFAIVPAALELERFGPRGRLAVFAMQWFVGAVLFCRLAFVYP